jgi:hypothetical protein
MSSNNRVILQSPFCIIKELDRYKILFPDDSADGGKFFYIAVSNALELYGGLSVYMPSDTNINIFDSRTKKSEGCPWDILAWKINSYGGK